MLARRSRPSPFLPITSPQPQHYHGITHSFAQRQPSIPPIFNSFRTLSVATGVVPPGYQNPEEHRLCGLCAPISVPSVLRFFPHLLAVICATWRPYPLWTHSVAHTSRHHGGCPHNPSIFSVRQLSDTILLLCLRRQRDGATRPPCGFPE